MIVCVGVTVTVGVTVVVGVIVTVGVIVFVGVRVGVCVGVGVVHVVVCADPASAVGDVLFTVTVTELVAVHPFDPVTVTVYVVVLVGCAETVSPFPVLVIVAAGVHVNEVALPVALAMSSTGVPLQIAGLLGKTETPHVCAFTATIIPKEQIIKSKVFLNRNQFIRYSCKDNRFILFAV